MIQVCSQCGTRWNVRDRQRVWCPRCRGTLLAPSTEVTHADPRWSPRSAAQSAVRARTPPRLPPGYRWIAVRPGAPPPARRRRPPLGPTPRYTAIPRWGLVDRIDPGTAGQASAVRQAPPAARVRAALFASVVVLGLAALVHVVRYVLLIINRNTLLNSVVAVAAVGLGVLVSLAAITAVSICAIVLTRWLIARRAAAFTHCGRSEPRPGWALWVGCLLPPSIALVLAITFAVLLATLGHPASWALMAGCVAICCIPLVAVVWALVYVIELAKTEQHYSRLRRTIWGWWLLWLLSSVTSVLATVTGGAQDAQGIANNTVAMTVAYLLASAAVLATARVFEGFERKPVERPAHRWVVVADDGPTASGSAPTVELAGAEPAA
ncbi:MAG: DUF4328 domain-containing protein [Mycobacterium sp.]